MAAHLQIKHSHQRKLQSLPGSVWVIKISLWSITVPLELWNPVFYVSLAAPLMFRGSSGFSLHPRIFIQIFLPNFTFKIYSKLCNTFFFPKHHFHVVKVCLILTLEKWSVKKHFRKLFVHFTTDRSLRWWASGGFTSSELALNNW